MSRKGNCWDNAVAESFFATLKNEEVTGTCETRATALPAMEILHGTDTRTQKNHVFRAWMPLTAGVLRPHPFLDKRHLDPEHG
jgi:transposase InsO family protein